MDLYFFISLVSLALTGIFRTVLSAPTVETPTRSGSEHHVRTKRCSCTNFLDTECVYFCHLDIIWVNTPERVVSYGLGNAPRTKRATQDSPNARCRCHNKDDRSCTDFCHLDDRPRLDAAPDEEIQSVHRKGCLDSACKHQLAAGTRGTRRVKTWLSPQTLRDALKIRLISGKWRQRLRSRARAGERRAP